jgi:hypothetical protein
MSFCARVSIKANPLSLHSPEFQGLDNALVAFQLSIPRQYHQAELHAASDTRVSLVHAIPHASVILLHEPFVTMEDGDPSMKKCSVAAREILKAIVTLYSELSSSSLSARGAADPHSPPSLSLRPSAIRRFLLRHCAPRPFHQLCLGGRWPYARARIGDQAGQGNRRGMRRGSVERGDHPRSHASLLYTARK